jgi:hypothetical protein
MEEENESFACFFDLDNLPRQQGYIQDVKKCMLQCSMADRWVQCDHILLIYPCPETLPFGTTYLLAYLLTYLRS